METVILVDHFDNEIGREEKLAVHEKALLHRAFSVFLMDGPRMLLQKRQSNKYHSAGLWANACCSHPRSGESTADAAPRRLWEEMGVECALNEVFSFVYFAPVGENLIEYEYDHVFVGKYHGPVRPNPEEAEEVRWVHRNDLSNDMLQNPRAYAPWFHIAAPKIMALLHE